MFLECDEKNHLKSEQDKRSLQSQALYNQILKLKKRDREIEIEIA